MLVILPTDKRDKPIIKHLADKYLGNNYLDILLELDDPLILVAHCPENTIVGFAVANIEDNIGILRTVVVDENYRGWGIGTVLAAKRMQYLEHMGVKGFRSYAWVHKDGTCPANGHLTKLGFEPTHDIPNYWADTQNEERPCLHCGPKCECTARVYIRALTVEKE